MMKDYYAILGVLRTAEQVVIRAAYRALAQLYHPDKGGKSTTAAMVELNEAFSILSDPDKRRDYDAQLAAKGNCEGLADNPAAEQAMGDASRSLEADWSIVVDYYPDVTVLVERLARVSYKLAFAFQIQLLESKEFDKRILLASELETNFLRTFFGTNPKIVDYARLLIFDGHRAAAQMLNKTLTVLGDKASAAEIIERIDTKFELNKDRKSAEERKRKQDLIRHLAIQVHYFGWVSDAIALVFALDGQYVENAVNSTSVWKRTKKDIAVTLNNQAKKFESDFDFAQWVKTDVAPLYIR